MPHFVCYAIALLLLAGCQQEQKTNSTSQTIRVAANQELHSLDPRSARSLTDATALNMLYEGLMRFTASGKLAQGAAASVDVSPDLTTYTFHLRRDGHWSNGDPVTSEDFLRSWRQQLEPSYPAPNAFVFYPIKNSRAAKAGSVPISEVGVNAPDPYTLVVKLEEPTPYFLELVACYAMFPVHVSDDNGSAVISNGPFQLERYTPTDELAVVKNPRYWDAEHVQLDKISIAILDEETSLSLFEAKELDWIGSPLSTIPPDAFVTLQKENMLLSAPVAATHFLRFNVEKAPFNNVNLRRALSLAINRQELIDNVIHGQQIPAMGLVPASSKWQAKPYFPDHAVEQAQQLYQEALKELKGKPSIKMSYAYTPRNHKIMQAIQQQWHQALNLWVELDAMEGQLFYERLRSGDYQIANGSWFADFDDPFNFLEVFDSKDNGTNNTGWQDSRYSKLLKESALAANATARQALLQRAEAILIDEMPISPIFFYSLNYVKAPNLQEVVISPLGIQIFRNGYQGAPL